MLREPANRVPPSVRMSVMPIAEPVPASPSAALDITWVRSQFPALAQTINGHPAVFLDGPGGTQGFRSA